MRQKVASNGRRARENCWKPSPKSEPATKLNFRPLGASAARVGKLVGHRPSTTLVSRESQGAVESLFSSTDKTMARADRHRGRPHRAIIDQLRIVRELEPANPM